MANLIEKMAGTDPDNRDCDGDGLIDGGELLAGTDPLDPDTDGIGASDINKVNIVVDGYDDDWQRLRIAPKLKDKVGDSRTKMIGTDLDSVSLALDRGNLYVIAKLANGEILDNQTQYYWGSLLDVDLDNKEDFEIGFNTFGDSWLWDLAKTGGYSNRDNVRQIDDADSAHGDLVEFRFSLNEIKPIERFKLGFFIGTITNDQYVSGDFAGFSSTIQAKDTIPPRGINLTTPKIVAKEAIAQAQETIDMASCLGMEKQVTDAQDKLNEAIVAFRLADYQQAYLIAESAGKDISEGFRIEIQTKSQSISISDTTSTEILYQANWQYVTITAIVFAIFAVAVAFARHRKK
jgi:hypothetical protein